MGDPRVLAPARASIDQWSGDPNPQKRLCEEKVELLSTYPKRVQAYHHALWDSRFDNETKVWAVVGLARLHTPEAKSELESYASFLDAAADLDSPLKVTVANALGNPPR